MPTVPKELQQPQVNRSFPAGTLGQRDAVSRGCKHFPTADGDQLASLVLPSHVIENSSIVDEGVQLPATLLNNTLVKISRSSWKWHKKKKKKAKQNLFKRAFLTVLQRRPKIFGTGSFPSHVLHNNTVKTAVNKRVWGSFSLPPGCLTARFKYRLSCGRVEVFHLKIHPSHQPHLQIVATKSVNSPLYHCS